MPYLTQFHVTSHMTTHYHIRFSFNCDFSLSSVAASSKIFFPSVFILKPSHIRSSMTNQLMDRFRFVCITYSCIPSLRVIGKYVSTFYIGMT